MIAHFDENDVHHGRAGRLLAALDVEPAITSPLSRAEVLVAPARAGRRRVIEDALDRIDIAVDDLPGDTAGQLAELRAHRPHAAGLLRAAHRRAARAGRDHDFRRQARPGGGRARLAVRSDT